MPIKLHWIEGPWPGRLATMPRPRGGLWLDDEIIELRKAGVAVVVSLLEPAEIAELELGQESQICSNAGIEFFNSPIPDYSVPLSTEAFRRLVDTLDQRLRSGTAAAVHCRMGIGRSSLLAAALLVRNGLQLSDAWSRISDARGLAVPDTDQQREWLADFVKANRQGSGRAG